MSSNPLISIIVLNWNGATIFPSCLDSLAKLDYRPVEVLFVDNGSTDESLRLAAGFPNIKIVENKTNLGYAAGNNRAMQFVNPSSTYVCFLNNDIEVTPGWLNEAIRNLENNPRIGAIACRNMNFFNRDLIDGLYHYIRSPFISLRRFGHGLPYHDDDPLYSEPGYVASALGASAIYRTALFKSLGGFDESFFAYYEDSDLCMRINNSGNRCLYIPEALVYHKDRASFKKHINDSFYYSERNKLYFIRKNFPPSFIAANMYRIIAEELWFIFRCLCGKQPLRPFLKARLDSLKTVGKYSYSGRAKAFDPAFIAELMKKKKIAMRD
jgi:GT2 family glycosyltransferase